MATDAREARARRKAAGQGLALEKSRKRDPLALGGRGKWWVVREDGTVVAGGTRREGITLEQVEKYLTGRLPTERSTP